MKSSFWKVSAAIGALILSSAANADTGVSVIEPVNARESADLDVGDLMFAEFPDDVVVDHGGGLLVAGNAAAVIAAVRVPPSA